MLYVSKRVVGVLGKCQLGMEHSSLGNCLDILVHATWRLYYSCLAVSQSVSIDKGYRLLCIDCVTNSVEYVYCSST
jgi:hypothetical protein